MEPAALYSAQYRDRKHNYLYCVHCLLSFNQLRGAGDLDSEETPGDAMIVSSSTATMLTEVRLLIVCIIVDVNLILVMNFFPLQKGMRGE